MQENIDNQDLPLGEEDILKNNEKFYSDFFVASNILSIPTKQKEVPYNVTFEELLEHAFTEDLFASRSFEELVQNEFEAKIYYEITSQDREWYFAGMWQIFIEQLRFSCLSINPQNPPSDNFKRLSFFGFNRYSKIEIKFFYRKCQQWIKWQENLGYQSIIEFYKLNKWEYTLREIQSGYGRLYYLIEIFIKYYDNIRIGQNKDTVLIPNYTVITKEEKSRINNGLGGIDRNEAYQQVLKITFFLKGEKKQPWDQYMTEEDFDKLCHYFRQLVDEGEADFTCENPYFKINNLQKRDIIYTFSLVNKFLYKKTRNLGIFKILGHCNDYQDILTALRQKKIRENTAYKDFSLRSKDYINHNPSYA